MAEPVSRPSADGSPFVYRDPQIAIFAPERILDGKDEWLELDAAAIEITLEPDDPVCDGYPEHDWELVDDTDGFRTYHCKR